MPAAVSSEEMEGLLVWFVLGRGGGRILEFIKRCAEPTSLGGLKMVATVLAGCLLLVGGGKSSMSFCLLPPRSECPTPRAPAPSKPLGCTTSYVKKSEVSDWILTLAFLII